MIRIGASGTSEISSPRPRPAIPPCTSMTSRSVVRVDRARGAQALAVLSTVLVCTRAGAQSSDLVELAWHAPSGCPSAQDVQARIRKLAGPLKTTDTPLRAEATITRIAGARLH